MTISNRTIEEIVSAALVSVLPNTHAVALPASVTWPALVFKIDTAPESRWVLGGGYAQHEVKVSTFARSRSEINDLKERNLAALEVLDEFLGDGLSGDAEYQLETGVYVYVQNFRLRTRR
ncbi:hypothetical protein [Pseudoduganella sp. HUAS MS19]